jgi:hypothetical protein
MMNRRPELYDVYLAELLALFADKGVAIQNIAISKHQIKVCIRRQRGPFWAMKAFTDTYTNRQMT